MEEMAHHGSGPFDGDKPEKLEPMHAAVGELQQLLQTTTGFRGALGNYPEGKLTPTDEGAIQFAVGGKDGKVVLEFGTPVAWVGFSPEDAVRLAETLVEHARRQTSGVLTMNLGRAK